MIDVVRAHKIAREHLETYQLNDIIELQKPIFRHGDQYFHINCLREYVVLGEFVISLTGEVISAPTIEELHGG